jgi:hypothetical protein
MLRDEQCLAHFPIATWPATRRPTPKAKMSVYGAEDHKRDRRLARRQERRHCVVLAGVVPVTIEGTPEHHVVQTLLNRRNEVAEILSRRPGTYLPMFIFCKTSKPTKRVINETSSLFKPCAENPMELAGSRTAT